MATIYPADRRYYSPESKAEERLYEPLARLDEDFSVICNANWHVPGTGMQKPQAAEADFLIAHPDRGVLILEVKGGTITHDPKTGRWTTTGKGGQTTLKRSPFDQVQRTRYLLRDMFKAAGHSGYGRFLGEALAFPDTYVQDGDIPTALLPTRVMDHHDMSSIADAIDRAFETWKLNGHAKGFGQDGIDSLVATVAAPTRIERPLGAEIEDVEERFVQLTENQYRVLDQLDGNQRVCVIGGAGTGKTLLAVEESRRLAAQGHRVLLTCFNAPLAWSLMREFKETETVTVANFHRLCQDLAREAQLDARKPKDDVQQFYDEALPKLLVEAAAKLGTEFDAVLVDEAQDFFPGWLESLELLLGDRDTSVFFLFCDENQTIHVPSRFQLPEGFPTFRLLDNCRNTKQIHQLLAKYLGDPSKSAGPDGPAVSFGSYSDSDDLNQLVAATIAGLIDDGVNPSDITVLTGHSLQSTALKDGIRYGSHRLTAKPASDSDVRLASIHRFKGLESPVVVLCEFEEVREEAARALWYTGLSRARSHLTVLLKAGPDGEPDLGGLLEKWRSDEDVATAAP